jgi:nicotinamide riboside kinase
LEFSHRHHRYRDERSPEVEAIAVQHRRPGIYLLTDVNTPYVQDGSLDGESIREWMRKTFVAEAIAHLHNKAASVTQARGEDREWRNDLSAMMRSSILDPPSSMLHPRSSIPIFDTRYSIPDLQPPRQLS